MAYGSRTWIRGSTAGRAFTSGVGERDPGAPFISSRGEERRIRRCEAPIEHQGGGEGNAVRERQRPLGAMVVAGVQHPGTSTDPLVDGDNLQASSDEPTEFLEDLIGEPPLVANQHVEDLGQIDRADLGPVLSVAQQGLDFWRRGFVGQGGDESLRVEDCQGCPRRRSFAARSSSRSRDRSSSLAGARPLSDPTAAPMGSPGMGRMTRALPSSSRTTRRVPQRCRTCAGTEICPPFEIVVLFMNRSYPHVNWLSIMRMACRHDSTREDQRELTESG